MPDLSADRPLPLPKKQFTDDDVELISNVMLDSNRTRAAEGLPTPAWCDLATAVLTALAAAGRLLPPDAEHLREQFGVMGDDPIRKKVNGYPKGSREAAEEEIADYLADLEPGAVDPWNLRLGHRWLTSWVEVEGSAPNE